MLSFVALANYNNRSQVLAITELFVLFAAFSATSVTNIRCYSKSLLWAKIYFNLNRRKRFSLNRCLKILTQMIICMRTEGVCYGWQWQTTDLNMAVTCSSPAFHWA